jgi:hypothetical protein
VSLGEEQTMNGWNDDLRRGHVARNSMCLMGGVSLVGLVLLYAGPVPGLGFLLVIGGLAGAALTFAAGWPGR